MINSSNNKSNLLLSSSVHCSRHFKPYIYSYQQLQKLSIILSIVGSIEDQKVTWPINGRSEIQTQVYGTLSTTPGNTICKCEPILSTKGHWLCSDDSQFHIGFGYFTRVNMFIYPGLLQKSNRIVIWIFSDRIRLSCCYFKFFCIL